MSLVPAPRSGPTDRLERTKYGSVCGIHAGPIDTDTAKHVTVPNLTPQDVVQQVLSAIEARQDEVLVDDMSPQVKAGLSDEPSIYLNCDPERAVPAASV